MPDRSRSGVPRKVSLVIGWLRSTEDGSFTRAQSVTIVRSLIFHAPSRFSYLSRYRPRHIEAALHLGADVGDVADDEAGTALAEHLVRIMRAVGMPNGLSAVGYREADCAALADGAWPQQRLLQNAPVESDKALLAQMFQVAVSYW